MKEYEKRVQKVPATDRLKASVDMRNSSVLVHGNGDESGVQWTEKVLLLFKVSDKESNESQEHAFSRDWR